MPVVQLPLRHQPALVRCRVPPLCRSTLCALALVAPLPLGGGVSPGGELENEYVAAQRFIHSAPLEANIDNAWLETVARKIRGRVEPVLAAVAQLRAAIEAQN